MSISVQNSTAALIALENLTTPSAGSDPAKAGAANQAAPVVTAPQPSSVLDVSAAAAADGSGGAISQLSNAASIADAAVNAGGTIAGLLAQMRQTALSATDPDLDGSARGALNASFRVDMAQIGSVVSQASVGGVNLIDGSGSGADNGSGVSLTAANLSLGGPLIGLSATASLSDPATAAAVAGTLETAVGAVGQAVGQIATQGQAIESHLDLVIQAALSSSPAVSGSVDAGLDADGARLLALQVQQQLQSGGAVGNTGPQSILALFK